MHKLDMMIWGFLFDKLEPKNIFFKKKEAVFKVISQYLKYICSLY